MRILPHSSELITKEQTFVSLFVGGYFWNYQTDWKNNGDELMVAVSAPT